MTRITNTLNTGLAAGTAVTAENSGNGGAGTAFTWVDVLSPSTLTYQSAQRYGASGLSIQFDQSTTSGAALFDFEGVGLTGKTWAFRYYFRLPVNPSNGVRVHTLYNTSDVEVHRMTITSARALQLRTPANVVLATSSVLALNTWYRMEVSVTAGTTTSNGVVKAQVYTLDDAVSPLLDYTSSAQNTGTANLGYLRVGRESGGLTLDAYFDEFAMDDALAGALIGPVGGWPSVVVHAGAFTVAAVSTVATSETKRAAGAVTITTASTVTVDGVARTVGGLTVPAASDVAIAGALRAPASFATAVTSGVSMTATARRPASVTAAAVVTAAFDATALYQAAVTVATVSASVVDGVAVLRSGMVFGLDTAADRDFFASGGSTQLTLAAGEGRGGRDALVTPSATGHRNYFPAGMGGRERVIGDQFEVWVNLDDVVTPVLGGIQFATLFEGTIYQALIDPRNFGSVNSTSLQIRTNSSTTGVAGTLSSPGIQAHTWYRVVFVVESADVLRAEVYTEAGDRIATLSSTRPFMGGYVPGLYGYSRARFNDFGSPVRAVSSGSFKPALVLPSSVTTDAVSTSTVDAGRRTPASFTVAAVSTVTVGGIKRTTAAPQAAAAVTTVSFAGATRAAGDHVAASVSTASAAPTARLGAAVASAAVSAVSVAPVARRVGAVTTASVSTVTVGGVARLSAVPTASSSVSSSSFTPDPGAGLGQFTVAATSGVAITARTRAAGGHVSTSTSTITMAAAAVKGAALVYALDNETDVGIFRSGLADALTLVPGGLDGRNSARSDASLTHRQFVPSIIPEERLPRSVGDAFEVSVKPETAGGAALAGIALARSSALAGYQFLIDTRDGNDGSSTASMQVRLGMSTATLLGAKKTSAPIDDGMWYRLRVEVLPDGAFLFEVRYEGSRALIGSLVTTPETSYTWYNPGLYAYSSAWFNDFGAPVRSASAVTITAGVRAAAAVTASSTSAASFAPAVRRAAAVSVAATSAVAAAITARRAAAVTADAVSAVDVDAARRTPAAFVVAAGTALTFDEMLALWAAMVVDVVSTVYVRANVRPENGPPVYSGADRVSVVQVGEERVLGIEIG